MELGLKDKVALITGTGSQRGFGKSIALTLAKEGCHIIGSDIDLSGAEQTATQVKAIGRQALALRVDITNRTEVDEMVKASLAKFGKIDILVNNAGKGTLMQTFLDSTEEEWDLGINVNLRGTVNCTKAVLPHMVSRKSGKIVNIASTAGMGAIPLGTPYGAAKAGVINFTASLALEVAGSGINVNCVAPGVSQTAFYDRLKMPPEQFKAMDAEGKIVTPQDIANAVAFLVSDVSIHILGQCMRVSGAL